MLFVYFKNSSVNAIVSSYKSIYLSVIHDSNICLTLIVSNFLILLLQAFWAILLGEEFNTHPIKRLLEDLIKQSKYRYVQGE